MVISTDDEASEEVMSFYVPTNAKYKMIKGLEPGRYKISSVEFQYNKQAKNKSIWNLQIPLSVEAGAISFSAFEMVISLTEKQDMIYCNYNFISRTTPKTDDGRMNPQMEILNSFSPEEISSWEIGNLGLYHKGKKLYKLFLDGAGESAKLKASLLTS